MVGARRIALLFALAGLLVAGSGSADTTITFRQGVNGYAGTRDLHLTIPENFTGNGHPEGQHATDPDNPQWVWDGEATWGEGSVQLSSGANRSGVGDNVGLIRFDDLFGSQPGQIPPGSTIVSATLELYPDNHIVLTRKPGDAANVHEVLVEWDESTRWDDFGPTPGPDVDVDYDHAVIANTGPTANDFGVDVTASLSAWSQDPASNHGWLFMPAGTEDTIAVSGSNLGTVTKVTVDLEITTQQRGEVVVTLRRGGYTALLLDRIRAECDLQFGSLANDFDVTIDDDAATDVHFATDALEPLTGSFKPDGACFSRPLCTGGGTGGLCGQPADGDWTLSVSDEFYAAGQVQLVSWGITLSDGVNPDETYTSAPALAVPKRGVGSGYASAIWSSENPTESLRPKLRVTYEEAPSFWPAMLQAHPQSGARNVVVRIPDGTNASSDVTVTLSSDDPSVANPAGGPIVFAAGGASQAMATLQIGQAGTATVHAANDAGLATGVLRVEVGVFSVAIEPSSLHRKLGAASELTLITIPAGSNANAPVQLTLSSSDPNVVDPQGAVGGALPVVFPAGGGNQQHVMVDFGGSVGAATLTASDDAAVLGSAVVPAGLSVDDPQELDVRIEPYVQLGDALPGAATDQFVVAWQTILRETGGANADRFTVEYRVLGDPTWLPVTPDAPLENGSTSRRIHSARVTGLGFDEQVEYRVTHLRNEVPIATWQETVETRKSGALRFTAFGNTGQAGAEQEAMAQLLASFDPDLHLLLGDNVYFHGEYQHFEPRIADVYADTMKTRPFFHTLGNHDKDTSGGDPTRDFFFVPENGPAALASELNYSFDVGDVHFVSVNSGSGLGGSSIPDEIAPWLAADLAASSKPWKVVFTHEPPVTRDPYGIDREENALVRDELLKAAVDNGAQLFLAGATHSMQRYLPITDVVAIEPFVRWSSCQNGNGTTLVYAGTGSWFRSPPGPIPAVLDPPMEVYAPERGIAVIDVANGQMTVNLVDESGTPIDTVTIDQCLTEQDCQCASSMTLFGIAEGGFEVSLTIAGVLLTVQTTPLLTSVSILQQLEALANSDPTLQTLGFTAWADPPYLHSNATIKNITITDPRLAQTLGELNLPALSPVGIAILVIAIVAGAFLTDRRTRRSRN